MAYTDDWHIDIVDVTQDKLEDRVMQEAFSGFS